LYRKLLRAKLHSATVTGADLHYEGSIAIDTDLLTAAGIAPHESVNVTNGERFETYAIPSPAGSGEIMINGAAAHRAHVGDQVIIAAWGWFTEDELMTHKPVVVLLDAQNRRKP
jgi:aspartate 1-decarboxylase